MANNFTTSQILEIHSFFMDSPLCNLYMDYIKNDVINHPLWNYDNDEAVKDIVTILFNANDIFYLYNNETGEIIDEISFNEILNGERARLSLCFYFL